MNHRAFIGDLTQISYLNCIQAGLNYIGFNQMVTRDTRLFIKPNLTFPSYKPGVMTSTQAIEAAILAIRGYTPHIYIGDSDSGGYNRFSMDDVYRETGIQGFAEKLNVQVVNLSKLERRSIQFAYGKKLFSLDLPVLLMDEIDLTVTMPVPKVHTNTGVSLTFKNQWGCIPENRDRLRLHPYIHHVLLEVNKAIKTKVAIVDGTFGLNVNGPMRGMAVPLDWILVTNSIGSGARVSCELMQITLEKIRHLLYAKELGWIPDLTEIQFNQDIHPFKKEKFYLKRPWTDIPGLLAFKNPFLTYLAYFSPLADILHRILYLFREPFYDYKKVIR